MKTLEWSKLWIIFSWIWRRRHNSRWLKRMARGYAPNGLLSSTQCILSSVEWVGGFHLFRVYPQPQGFTSPPEGNQIRCGISRSVWQAHKKGNINHFSAHKIDMG